MLASEPAVGAVGDGRGGAGPTLPRPCSSNPVAEVPEEALELGMLAIDRALGAVRGGPRRRGTRLHRIGSHGHHPSKGSTAPAKMLEGMKSSGKSKDPKNMMDILKGASESSDMGREVASLQQAR